MGPEPSMISFAVHPSKLRSERDANRRSAKPVVRPGNSRAMTSYAYGSFDEPEDVPVPRSRGRHSATAGLKVLMVVFCLAAVSFVLGNHYGATTAATEMDIGLNIEDLAEIPDIPGMKRVAQGQQSEWTAVAAMMNREKQRQAAQARALAEDKRPSVRSDESAYARRMSESLAKTEARAPRRGEKMAGAG